MKQLLHAAICCAVLATGGVAGAADFMVPTKPAADLVTASVGPAPSPADAKIHTITWGPDLATYLANGGVRTTPDSAFGKAGISVTLVKEDDTVKQANDYVAGTSPSFRGTMGMLNTYTEAFNRDERTRPVVALQLSRSTGGDCLVVRGDAIKSVADLKGQTVVLQQNGPHVEFMDKLLTDAGLGWKDVDVKWCSELYDLDGAPNDPANIMRSDPSVDAVFCIYPDAVALSSGDGEFKVDGAHILVTTKSAGNVIVDVLAFRRDFFDANKEWVGKFVRTQLEAQDRLEAMMRAKDAEFQKAVAMGADLLLDNPQDTAGMEGLLADATLARGGGNYSFFVDRGNLAGFAPNIERNQKWLVAQGFVRQAQDMKHADWDFLHGFSTAARTSIQVDTVEAQKFVAKIDDSGVLMQFEIRFGVNQQDFQVMQYRDDFRKALEWSANYSGAIIEIVGHSDPYQYLLLKYNQKASEPILERTWRSGQTLSLQRAESVRESLIGFAGENGITVNESQFITTGKGFEDPAVARPQGEADLAKNRRVVFRIVNVESESGIFKEAIKFD